MASPTPETYQDGPARRETPTRRAAAYLAPLTHGDAPPMLPLLALAVIGLGFLVAARRRSIATKTLEKPPASPKPAQGASSQAAPKQSAAQAPKAAAQASAGSGSGVVTDAKGVLLAAVRAGTHEAPAWDPVKIGDVTFYMARDAVRAPDPDGGKLLRLPTSYDEMIPLAAAMGDVIPPSKSLADAAYAAAPSKTVLRGLWRSPESDKKLQSLEFSRAWNKDLDEQIGGKQGVLTYGGPKIWLLSPKTTATRAALYGGRKPDGSLTQSGDDPKHNRVHGEYPAVFQPLKRWGSKDDGSRVDMLQWIAEHDGVPEEVLAPFRGGPSA